MTADAAPPSPPIYVPASPPLVPVAEPAVATAVTMKAAPAKQGSSAAVWVVGAVVGVLGVGALFSFVMCAGILVLMSSSRSRSSDQLNSVGDMTKGAEYSSPYGNASNPSLSTTPAYVPSTAYESSGPALPSQTMADTPTPAQPVATAPVYDTQSRNYFDDWYQEPEESHWDREVRRLGELGQEMRDRQNAP